MISHNGHEFEEANRSEGKLDSCFLTGLHMGKSIILIKNVLIIAKLSEKKGKSDAVRGSAKLGKVLSCQALECPESSKKKSES